MMRGRCPLERTSQEWKNWLEIVQKNANKTRLDYILSKIPGRDDRAYLTVHIYGIKMKGLLDSGANRTILGKQGWDILSKLRLHTSKSTLGVSVANGGTSPVDFIVDVPFTLEGHVCLLPVLVVLEVTTPLILGIDFWRKMNIIPDITSNTWTFASSETLPYGVEAKPFAFGLLTKENEAALIAFKKEYVEPIGNSLGCTNLVEHRIDTGSAVPIKQRYYPVSPIVLKTIHEEVDEMLRLGVIEKSSSPWSSPILLVKKKDGGHRFVVDFRKLNEVTVRDAYPLPYVNSILDRLRGAKFLSSLDLKSAYWQVPLEKSSREKTAFTIPGKGLFHFLRLPFGLHNSPATWQRLVDSILGTDLEPYVFIYLDDFIIVTPTFEEHLRVLKEILLRLRYAGLTVNTEKCKFCLDELKYLGYVVNQSGLHVDPEKVECIVNYPAPTNIKAVKRFVGMTSWYRRFIPNYAITMSPLHALTKKNVTWEWTSEAEAAFCSVKELLVSAPILTCPDFNLPFIVQADASSYGIGSVLSQHFEEGEKVIAYYSRSLTKAERNFTVTEKECLAVIWSIEKMRPYLEGSTFTVITDHHSLLWLHNLRDPTGRLARWAIRLQQYDFKIVHRKGTEHVVPDALSRAVAPAPEEIDLITVSEKSRDNWYSGMLYQVKENPQKYPSWRVERFQLYKLLDNRQEGHEESTWRIVVPKDKRKEILKECHDAATAGHLGSFKTWKRASQLYYWPKMRPDINKYVRKCQTCAQYKVEQKKPGGLMGKDIEIDKPWQMISSDLMGPFPRSTKQNRYLLVISDYFTKFTLIFPLRQATAKAVVRHMEEVILMYGAPQLVRCDNGTQYTSHEFRELLEKYESKALYNPHYHPQVNPTERVNRVMKTMIASYVNANHRHWDKHLHELGFALRSANHEVTGYTPNFLNFGREVRLSGRHFGEVDPRLELTFGSRDQVTNKLKTLGSVYQDVTARLKRAYETNKKVYNLRRRPIEFAEGEKVWRKNFAQSDAANFYTSKLAPKYVGPFTVRKKISPLVYDLENEKGKSIGRWHIKDLKNFIDAEVDFD